eukprot:SAG11_NODE_759_length_7305_cov_2.494865_2_plen_50_part_00
MQNGPIYFFEKNSIRIPVPGNFGSFFVQRITVFQKNKDARCAQFKVYWH